MQLLGDVAKRILIICICDGDQIDRQSASDIRAAQVLHAFIPEAVERVRQFGPVCCLGRSSIKRGADHGRLQVLPSPRRSSASLGPQVPET